MTIRQAIPVLAPQSISGRAGVFRNIRPSIHVEQEAAEGREGHDDDRNLSALPAPHGPNTY